MHMIVLKKNNQQIELLIGAETDISLITANAEQLFEYKAVFENALQDFMSDHSESLNRYKPMIDSIKASGVVGYPVTPAKDARLYAIDRGIVIDSELEIECG